MPPFIPCQQGSRNCDRSTRTAASGTSTRLTKAGSCTPWHAVQSVTRALTILLCQLAPTHASGAKPGFCKWSLLPRHRGDSGAKVEIVERSVLAFSSSPDDAEPETLREAR